MNAFRGIIKQMRAEIEEAKAKEAFLELLRDGDNVERAIGEKRAQLDALANDENAARQRITEANEQASRIVGNAELDAAALRASAEQDKVAAINKAVVAALAETGDEAAAIVEAARKQAETAEKEAAARLDALRHEITTAEAERDAAKAELSKTLGQIADAHAERRKLAEALARVG